MNSLALKLMLVPAITGAASLAGRRWGPTISGWLVGLPLTSSPIIFFLALSQGTSFAVDAATGTLTSGLSLVGFCLTYHLAAYRYRWPISIIASLSVLAALNEALQYVTAPLAAVGLAVLAALLVALRVVSVSPAEATISDVDLPRWDIAARMAAATAFVLLITETASLLGPRLSGLVSTFPLVAGTLTVFAHHQHGADAARRVVRGLLMGLFAFTGFYCVLIFLLAPAGVELAFAAAVIAALAVQGGTLWIMQRWVPLARTGLG